MLATALEDTSRLLDVIGRGLYDRVFGTFAVQTPRMREMR